jgi:hypothetical protein
MTDARHDVVAGLRHGPISAMDLARRPVVAPAHVRPHLVRLCELGLAAGLVVGGEVFYRQRYDVLTAADVEKAEARIEAMVRGRTEAAA